MKDVTTTEKGGLAELRELAAVKGDAALVHPKLTAQDIGVFFWSAFELVGPAIPKGRREAFEQRALDGYSDGVFVEGYFRGQDFALCKGPEGLIRQGVDVQQDQFEFIRCLAQMNYHQNRARLANTFIEYWEELQAFPRPRGRGRPAGSSDYVDADADVMLDVLLWMARTFGPDLELGEAQTRTEAKLSELVVDRLDRDIYPSRGSNKQEAVQTHKKRLRPVLKKAVEPLLQARTRTAQLIAEEK